MRIYGTNGTGALAAAVPARRQGADKFVVSDAESSRASDGAPAVRTIGGIDALMALQGVGDPAERRRRAVSRGRGALDALDDLKVGLLSGTLDPSTLARLRASAAELGESSDDEGLDAVLAEIGLRVEVELAKFANPSRRG